MTPEMPLPPRRLEVSGLSVARDGRTLLSGIAFTLAPGGLLLIRGANGAGKSSLLLTLAGILRPAAGHIAFADDEPVQGRDLHLMGHLAAVKPRETLAEHLRFVAMLYGAKSNRGAVAAAIDTVGLGGLDDHDSTHLSQGQTRRLGLARLLVAPRPLWLLDEPTAALDTAGTALVASLIDNHRRQGGSVVVATHLDLPVSLAGATTLAIGASA